MIAILGAGGHGLDVASIVRATGQEVEFYDDDPTKGFPPCWEAPDAFLLGVYDSRVRARMDRPAHESYIATHPDAVVDSSAIVDYGCVIGAGAVLGNGTTLGVHCHVGQNASLVRVSCGDYVTISPGAVICGDVFIGEGVTIGAGAVVSNLCELEPYSVLGAGAVLPPRTRVPRGAVWAGVPARSIVGEME